MIMAGANAVLVGQATCGLVLLGCGLAAQVGFLVVAAQAAARAANAANRADTTARS